MDTISNDTIREKANFYFEKQQRVHISIIKSIFYNGTIIKVNPTNLILIDDKLGETFLSFNEIYNIEPQIILENEK